MSENITGTYMEARAHLGLAVLDLKEAIWKSSRVLMWLMPYPTFAKQRRQLLDLVDEIRIEGGSDAVNEE